MSDQSIDIDTRSFYLGSNKDDVGVLYLSMPPEADPGHAELLVTAALHYGLQPFAPRGDVLAAASGWRVVFERLGPGDPAPLMSVLWPAFPVPLVYGVRKTSPVGWADDAVADGQLVLVVGPALDWPALITLPDSAADVLGIVTWEAVVEGIGGCAAAAGIVPTKARQP